MPPEISTIHAIATLYGPYAFGLVSLLIIWFTIVAPQLARQAVDVKEHQALAKMMQGIADSMERTAHAMREAFERRP